MQKKWLTPSMIEAKLPGKKALNCYSLPLKKHRRVAAYFCSDQDVRKEHISRSKDEMNKKFKTRSLRIRWYGYHILRIFPVDRRIAARPVGREQAHSSNSLSNYFVNLNKRMKSWDLLRINWS